MLLHTFLAPAAQTAGTLRFGLDFDLDTLDPARSGSYIERAVNASRCDQMLNIDAALNVVPELATAWKWSGDRLALTLHLRGGVQFQDGAALDAKAVRANLDRCRSAPHSLRRGELKPVAGIDMVNPGTVRIRLSTLHAPLLALLAGQLDIANRLAATDVASVEASPGLRVAASPSIGFEMLSFNLAHGPAADQPFGRDIRSRQAFAKAIDRDGINQAVFEGRFIPGNQTEAPGSRCWDPAPPACPRDLPGAKALLAAAGAPPPKLTLGVANSPSDVQVGEVIQSMAAEAGFEVRLLRGESVPLTDAAARGRCRPPWRSGAAGPTGTAAPESGCAAAPG